jgi:hypothetical protein
MKPICLPCQRFFRMKKAGFYFTEGTPMADKSGTYARAGVANRDRWKPYKVWSGDLWECRGCGAQIISGVGNEAISEKHHADFETVRAKLAATQFQVNDC